MVFIPGWIVSINKSELIKFFIKLKYQQSLESLSYYITRGEHNFDMPFGLYKKDNENYGIILRKNENLTKNCFLIGSNVISILEIDDSDWKVSEDLGIKIFLKNYVEYLITSHNHDYTPSNLVKTYLGQYSKGRISKRQNPLDILEFNFPYKVKFKLCEAEEFGVIKISKNYYLISYIPRFEIFDDILHLPQNEYTPVFEEWQEKMAKKSKNIYDRFKPINEIIRRGIKEQEIIKLTNDSIPQFETRVCSYPKFNFSKKYKDKLGLKPFSELYFNEVLDKMTKNSKLKLTIVIDLMSSLELDSKIHSFFVDIQKYFKLEYLFILLKEEKETDINVKDIQKFRNYLECQIIKISYSEFDKLNSYNNVLFIINNNIPGFQLLYSEFKGKVNSINKVLYSRTIIENDRENLLFGLLYLSFHFREKKVNDLLDLNELKPLISFSLQKDFDYEYIFLVSSYIQSNGKYNVKKKLIPTIDHYEQNQDLNDEIVTFLIENLTDIYNQFPDKHIVIFLRNSWDLKDYIDQSLKNMEFKQNFIVTVLQNIPIKLLNSGIFPEIPENGTFVAFGTDNYKTIVLLTNGGIDKPSRGIANPVVFNLSVDSQEKELDSIIAIFNHSFYHPTSFTKTNSPIEYHLLF